MFSTRDPPQTKRLTYNGSKEMEKKVPHVNGKG